MKTNVRNVSRDLRYHFHVRKIMYAIRRIVFPQQLKHRRHMPTLVAKLKHVLVTTRQRLDKLRQSFQIQLPTRRQLKQNRSQLLAQTIRSQKKLRRRTLRILQLLHGCDETTRLHCETESGRRRLSPVVESLRRRQSIEAVVDLDRVEVFREKLKHLRTGSPGRIKHVHPLFVVPTGSADKEFHFINRTHSIEPFAERQLSVVQLLSSRYTCPRLFHVLAKS